MSGQSRKEIIDAVCQVLRQVNVPLHFRDIAWRMTAWELWSPPYDDSEEWLDAIICEHIRVDPYRARLRRDDWGVFELSLSEERRGAPSSAPHHPGSHGRHPHPYGTYAGSNEIDKSLPQVAQTVMQRVGTDQRLHVSEIVKHAIRMRLLPPNLVNAEARMNVALKQAIRKQRKKAKRPVLVNPAEGYFQIISPEQQKRPTRPTRESVSIAARANSSVLLSTEEAASRVLADAKRPLYYLEIAREARRRGYTSLTANAFASELKATVMRDAQRGPRCRFTLVADDQVALAAWKNAGARKASR